MPTRRYFPTGCALLVEQRRVDRQPDLPSRSVGRVERTCAFYVRSPAETVGERAYEQPRHDVVDKHKFPSTLNPLRRNRIRKRRCVPYSTTLRCPNSGFSIVSLCEFQHSRPGAVVLTVRAQRVEDAHNPTRARRYGD